MKKTIRILFFAILVIAILAVPVFATDANGNDFVDFNDYSEYEFASDNSAVSIDVKFPSEWNNTYIHFGDTGLGDTWYSGDNFLVEADIGTWSKLNMHPVGGNMALNTDVGSLIANAHIIDLRYLPKGATLTYEFNVGISTYDVNIEEQIFTRYFFFVDSSGKVIQRARHYFDPVTNGHGSYTWIETVSVSSFPANAVGLVPMFVLRNFVPAFDDVLIELSSFRFVIPMSALEFQASQNEQLKDTMNSIQESMNELVEGEPDPVAPSGSDAIGDLNSAEDELKDMTQGGLDDAIELLQNTLFVLRTNATAFFAVISLFRPFSQIPLFAGLLTISLAVSVCAIILAITHDIGKASKAKSGHNGKKGGY